MAELKPDPAPTGPTLNRPKRWFGLAYLLIFVAGVGFFLLSFIALGVLPGVRLADSMERYPKNQMPDYTPAELRGRQIYASLGCALCHTQQVRFLPADVRRWGAPTEAWETRYDFPHVWGTRRIGPDLAREAGVRSDDWQLTHLYQPQSVVPDSVMPAFPWLFNGSPNRPTAQASDLLAYLRTLGRARHDAKGTRPAVVDNGMDPLMLMQITNLCAAPFINPSQARIDTTRADTPADFPPRAQLFVRGRMLFAQNCAGCHAAKGDGNGAAAAGLLPRPADLRQYRYSTAGLAAIVWNGVAGSAMPAWRELPVIDLASLTVYVQTLHTGKTDSAPAAQILTRGATVYVSNCLSCHGVVGDGNGPVALALLPRPANFTLVQPDTARVLQVLNQGVAGTAMAAWPSLAPTDKQAVTAFVRSLFQPPTVTMPRSSP